MKMSGVRRKVSTAWTGLRWGLLLAPLLAACQAEPFPDCCDAVGVRDVPYLTTYRFNFRTGSFDITVGNTDRFLGVLTQADALTLMNAAAVTQSTSNGLVSGKLIGPRGPLREGSLEITDIDGNAVTVTDSSPNRNFFYNSLGQVPDFLVNEGSTDQGSFTLFNAPPGELFMQLVGGGRGNGRLTAFPGAVSIGQFNTSEVFPSTIGSLGIVVDAATGATVPNVEVTYFAWHNPEIAGVQVADAGGLYTTPRVGGLPTQGTSLLRLSAPNYRTTYSHVNTGMSLVNARQQAFDPLTLDDLKIYSETGVQTSAALVGVSIPISDPIQPSDSGVIVGRVQVSDGTGVPNAVVTPYDDSGQPLGAHGHLFYVGLLGGQIDPNVNKTQLNGGYVLFVDHCTDVPGGTVYLNAVAKTITLPVSLNTGRASAPCIPGGVFVQDVFVQDFQSSGSYFTASLQGRVAATDNTGVADAQVQFLGVPPPPPPQPAYYLADSNGTYQVPRGALPTDVTPLLALSPYTAKISKTGYVTTYMDIVTGLNGGQQGLTVISESVQQAACGGSGTINVYGVVRDLGLVDASRRGLPTEGITLAVLDDTGQPVSQGRVVYTGDPNRQATDIDGVFAVCDLPPPSGSSFPSLYQLRVVSQDDSGAMPVQMFDDGVTVVTFVVNKALPREITTAGQVVTLLGPEGTGALPVGGAAVKVLGTKLTRTTNSSGGLAPNLSLPSNGHYLVRAEKDGYLPTVNYHLVTPASLRRSNEIRQLPPMKIAAKSDLDREGISWSSTLGIVAGKVIVPGFAAAQSLATGAGPTLSIFPGLFNVEDAFPDFLLVIPPDQVQFQYSDGAGHLYGAGSLHPPQTVTLTIPSGTPHITAVEPADFDLDGHPDLVAISDGTLYVFFGNNTGGFDQGQEVPLVQGGGAEAVAAYAVNVLDFDADGKLDLIVATNGINGGTPIARFVNKTGRSFVLRDRDPVGDPCASHRPRSLSTEIIPGTGVSAILIADADGTVCVYPTNPDGSMLNMKSLTLPAPPIMMQPAFADFDQISDVLVLHQQGVSVLLGVASQTDPLPPIEVGLPPGFAPNSLLLGDINLDGRNDLLISGQGGIVFLLGAGNGRFNTPTVLSTTPAGEMTSAFVNADGRPALIASQSNDLVQFPGADLAVAGTQLEARDETGRTIGTVRYLNAQGAVDAQATATTTSGRFVIDSLRPGFVMVRVRTGGSGNSLVTAYPGAVSYTELNTNPLPGTVNFAGQTIDPLVTDTSGTVAEGILVTPLGSGTQARSSCCKGPSDPTSAAFQLTLDGNSEYIIKLEP